MSMDVAKWSSGDALTFVWTGGTLMLSTDLDGADLERAVDRIWGSLSGEVTLGGILQLLTDVLGASLLSLPDFAVALFDGTAGQFAARGHFQVEVAQAAGTAVVAGLGVSTWSERAIDGIESISLGGAERSDDRGLPLRAGVVRASRVSWGDPGGPVGAPVAEAQPVRVTRPDWPSVDSPADPPDLVPAPPPQDPEPERSEPVSLNIAADDGSATVTPTSSPAETTGATTVVEPIDDEEPIDERAPVDAEPEPEHAAPGLPVQPPVSRFAALWGDTAAYSIEDAAVRVDDDEVAKPGFAAATPAPASPVTAHADPSVALQPQSNEEPDIISAVPGHSRAAAPPAGPATQDWSDHDGATVVGFSITAPAEPAPELVDAETVLALVCPAGHANRPHRETCRECGVLLSAGLTQTVSRPGLGQIRSSTGEVVPLTSPVLIGRSPRASRFQGTVSPRLLSLPYQHISSTHLEVRLEGWNVFAVDLNSMNGAYLRRRDEPPVRVTHTPLMLADGDVIDFGHGVSIAFEGMP